MLWSCSSADHAVHAAGASGAVAADAQGGRLQLWHCYVGAAVWAGESAMPHTQPSPSEQRYGEHSRGSYSAVLV